MLYKIIRPFLFLLPAETAHHVSLKSLQLLHRFGWRNGKKIEQPKKVFGLTFQNPLGLAAGLDKNGDYIDALAALGVGFIEVGAVTPLAQAGNPKPRLFRLSSEQAIINRMGFNNKGVDYLVEKLKQRQTDCIVGVNLGKNKETALDKAHLDYIHCLQKLYPYADFLTINISSPNTAGLTELQNEQYLHQLLSAIKQAGNDAFNKHQRYVPILVKLSPDLNEMTLAQSLKTIAAVKMDGIIANNTSQDHSRVSHCRHGNESGGLSGRPITDKSRQMLKSIHQHTHGEIPVIACGGIASADETKKRLSEGAALVQIYTGFIYQGPSLIKKILRCLPKKS